jgi:hypothetical protein
MPRATTRDSVMIAALSTPRRLVWADMEAPHDPAGQVTCLEG